MKLLSKVCAVAISALFAATPVVPANAMPVASSVSQPITTTGGTDVQLVRENSPQWIKRRMSGNYGRSYRDRGGRYERRWDRDRRAGWRDRSDRRGWRERGDRRGWYGGYRGYRYQRRGYRYYDGYWFPLAAFGAGAIIGGAIANDPGYGGGGSHVNWCANRYRSYRAYDNTFQPYNGPRRQCVSPYS